jgi:hypothetical protein
MSVDISHLTLDELHDLNETVCARIDELRAKNDAIALAHLRPGMTVQFKNGKETITGILLKKNRKTVVIAANNGGIQYKVPAGVVRPVHGVNTTNH